MKQPEPSSVEYLTMKQQEDALQHILEMRHPIFRFAMEYGLRIGEVRAIMKDAVKEGRIVIRRAFSDNELRESTKTGDVRSYDLTPYAKEMLAALPPHFSLVTESLDNLLNNFIKLMVEAAGVEPAYHYLTS
ncbi:MAG TPA: hypothetical protein VJZ49_10835 [Syntrophales bacterium]|nr:hypothetical protein [Syntrophales bacterium]